MAFYKINLMVPFSSWGESMEFFLREYLQVLLDVGRHSFFYLSSWEGCAVLVANDRSSPPIDGGVGGLQPVESQKYFTVLSQVTSMPVTTTVPAALICRSMQYHMVDSELLDPSTYCT
jgi:hypothetical protein